MNWKFWEKKEDDFSFSDMDFSSLSSSDTKEPSFDSSFGSSSAPDFSQQFSPPAEDRFQPSFQQPVSVSNQSSSSSGERNLQWDVVISRLDAIKIQLEHISSRLDKLEQKEVSSSPTQRGPWYAQR